jgi:GTP-binding protein
MLIAWKLKEYDCKFNIPSRGIIGLRNQLTCTVEAIMYTFYRIWALQGEISDVIRFVDFYGKGKAIPYSIDKLQDRGKFLWNQMLKSTKVK